MIRPCKLGRHAPAPGAVRNQAFEFSCCRRCGRDLVRSRGTWRTVPKGFRVVWRQPGPAAELNAAQLLLNLPASGRALALPPAPNRGKRRVATTVELVVLMARGLAELVADRFRSWIGILAAPAARSPPVLSLPVV
jgi:hypothetical protein